MPELPEVETTRLGLIPLVNQTVANVIIRNASLRWPIPHSLPDLLQGKTRQTYASRKVYSGTFRQWCSAITPRYVWPYLPTGTG